MLDSTSILLDFSFLKMRDPMFRWFGCLAKIALRLCQVCLQALQVVHQSIWVLGNHTFTPEKKVCGCCEKKCSAEYREVELWGVFFCLMAFFFCE
jgi:hypothetical protein